MNTAALWQTYKFQYHECPTVHRNANAWQIFNIKNTFNIKYIQEYAELYYLCLKTNQLDRFHYYTAPGLAFGSIYNQR